MHLEYNKAPDVIVDEIRDIVELKLTHSGASKKSAKRWDHRLSDESLAQGDSPLKDSAKTLNPSKTIPLGTGRPTSLYYPWQSMTMNGTKESRQSQTVNPTNSMTCTKGESAFDLSSALNYAEPSGWGQLVASFRETTRLIHNPPYKDWDTTLTCGSTSAIDIALRMFCNRGDWILTETFTYPGTLMASRAQGLKTQGIEMDEDGLVPQDLEAKLRCWDTSRGRKPFVLYTIPSGHNPTGITQSTTRKKAIYQIAERHDLLILEDDPYFFLRLNEFSTPLDTYPPFSLFDKFRESLPKSYLSLDKSGRVIRVESTSKILAPGLRCGWLTASRQIVDIFANFAEVGPSSPSGPSQVMLYKLLVENWGQEGFANWLNHLSGEYRSRRDAMIAACEKHLPKEICTWTTPTYGMFLWITVSLETHPDCAEKRTEKCQAIEDRIHERAEINGVLVARGSWFNVENCVNKVFFRMTFVATASQDDLEQGVEKFSKAVRDEFRL
ncbi:Aminotransferase swnA [Cladobotryum mycophilum]|uniref:Aminotransferase swnA n=1 Tax=Cladobotryum mycophilum TaxID=491253 RepID=A0ABR0SBM3_9HYPO